MGLIIQDKEIAGIVIGDQKFTKPIDNSAVWLDCPDVTKLAENAKVSFNKGASTIMKYDEATHTGIFKSDLYLLSTLTVPGGTNGIKVPVCMIQLPSGFVWGDGKADKATLSGWSSKNGVQYPDSNHQLILSYSDDRLYIAPNINAASYFYNLSLTPKTATSSNPDVQTYSVVSFTNTLKLPGVYQK